MKTRILVLGAALLAACSDSAQPPEPPAPPAPVNIPEADPEQVAAVRAGLGENYPELADSHITSTPIEGVYEVWRGLAAGYVSADGRYLVEGDLVDLATGRRLTEERRQDARLEALRKDGGDGIAFTPEGAPDAPVVTVFTDVDCGYCRKLHSEIENYLDEGLAINYLLYPRAGIGSASYTKAVSAWCSDDPQQAITRAKAGREIDKLSCEHPVNRHLQLGQTLGLRGTPMIVLPDGEVVQGYLPAEALAARVNHVPLADAAP